MSEKMGKQKSSFSVTCSLLSQYLKEKGSFGDLSRGIVAGPDETTTKGLFRPPTTMSLLPGADVSAKGDAGPDTEVSVSDRNGTKSMDLNLFPQLSGFDHALPAEGAACKNPDSKEPEKDQLTIFYGGKVLVFNNFPAAKAKDLLNLASKESSAATSTTTTATTAVADRPPATCPSTSGSLPLVGPSNPAQPNIPSDLPMPIARKASLHRFLEKRKDRISSKAPYQVNGAAASAAKPDGDWTWLGLGQQVAEPSTSSDSRRS